MTAPLFTAQKPTGLQRLQTVLTKSGVLAALVVVMITAAIVSPYFLTVGNLLNVMFQISIVGILAVGMTFVIITAGIDLSVASTLALSGVVAAMVSNAAGLVPGLLAGIGVGVLVGAANGIGAVFGEIPPFVMTLASMAVVTGVAFIVSGGQPVALRDPVLIAIGTGRLFGIPYPVVIFVVIALIASFVLNRTVYGRWVFAVGSNADAARLAGIPVRGVTVSVYLISGALAAIGGVLYAAQLSSATATAGQNLALDSIAATVLGGASLMGGIGAISGTFLGAAILGVVANTLNLLGVQTYVQDVAKGLIIVAAILIQNRLRLSTRDRGGKSKRRGK